VKENNIRYIKMPKKAAAKKVKEFKPFDRFTTPNAYKEFLGKKVKDFTPEEKKIYNSIATQYKRKPFGDELAVNSSSFLPIGEMPFASTAPNPLSDAIPNVLQGEAVEEPYVPTINDLRSILRQAGALDRTPPQLHHTPINEAVRGGDEVRGIEPLNVGDRMNERLIADQLREFVDEGRTERIRLKGIDQFANRKQALVDALGVIGGKRRSERGAELMAELARNEIPPPLDEARRLVEQAIVDYDRPARSVNVDKREAYRELMDGEVGDLKRALDEFNIPSDFLLKPTKKESRKAIIESTKPAWYEDGIDRPIPKSPREKRTDLQFGLNDPDESFDPDPVVVFDDDEEWMKEYLREDVLETTARREIAAGRREDPRPARRAAAAAPPLSLTLSRNSSQYSDGSSLSRASSGYSDASTTLSEIELDNLLLERLAQLTEAEADAAESPRFSGRPQRIDLREAEQRNPWKVGSREHRRYQETQLSEDLKFPPSEFTAERGRVQFGFDPQRFTLPDQDVEAFDLNSGSALPSWALSARSGINTFTPSYNPPQSDIGDDTYLPPEELARFSAGGRSLLNERTGALRKEDELSDTTLLPEDVVDVKGIVSTKEVLAAEPEVQVISEPQTLETTTTAGSGEVGEKKPFAPKVGGRRRKKKASKAAPLPVQEEEAVQSAADFFGFDTDQGFAGAVGGSAAGAGLGAINYAD
tara:strand:- start:1946 stop:4054 length:2109 start_codon:yes stop_codon:yes gene_type:complete